MERMKKLLRGYSIYKYLAFFYKIIMLYGMLLLRIALFRFPADRGFPKRKKPRVLQLPITYKCNFRCVMCGMHGLQGMDEFSTEELSHILRTPLFSKICSVGINGGEPFLLKDLEEALSTILDALPRLKEVYFITNGYFTSNILRTMPAIKRMCEDKGVKVVLSVSVDGVGDMQDFMRGKEGAFLHAEDTCGEILKDRDKYCDSFGLICTITKHNIFRINEVEAWAGRRGIPVSYNIATSHKRLFNEGFADDFSVFADEQARCLAAEFFYMKCIETMSPRYFALHRYLLDGRRISSCDFKYDGVTLTPNARISYCATRSEELGDALSGDAARIFMENLNYRKRLLKDRCGTCSHYGGSLTLHGWLQYNREILRAYNNPLVYRP